MEMRTKMIKDIKIYDGPEDLDIGGVWIYENGYVKLDVDS